jgi:hypothetical protein
MTRTAIRLVGLRLTDDELRIVEMRAALRGVSVSDLLRLRLRLPAEHDPQDGDRGDRERRHLRVVG